MIGLLVIVGLLLVVSAAVAAVSYGVLGGARSKASSIQRKTNQLVPGVEPVVPDSWAGQHHPEAKLYRRLKASIVASDALGDGANKADRELLQQTALNLAEQLNACAALPEPAHTERLSGLERDVVAFEALTADVLSKKQTLRSPELSGELDELAIQLEALEQARAEVEDIDRRGGGAVS